MKKHKLTKGIEFSIYMTGTLVYIDYEDGDFYENCLHIAVTLHYRGHGSTTSIYIPYSKLVQAEERKIRKHRDDYEPSEEFVHIIRAVIILSMKNWIRKRDFIEDMIDDMENKRRHIKDNK